MAKGAPSEQTNVLEVVQLETLALRVEDALLFRFYYFYLFGLFCLFTAISLVVDWLARLDLLQLALACMGRFNDFLLGDRLCFHPCHTLDGIAAVLMR